MGQRVEIGLQHVRAVPVRDHVQVPAVMPRQRVGDLRPWRIWAGAKSRCCWSAKSRGSVFPANTRSATAATRVAWPRPGPSDTAQWRRSSRMWSSRVEFEFVLLQQFVHVVGVLPEALQIPLVNDIRGREVGGAVGADGEACRDSSGRTRIRQCRIAGNFRGADPALPDSRRKISSDISVSSSSCE